jgi:hypothetical protein
MKAFATTQASVRGWPVEDSWPVQHQLRWASGKAILPSFRLHVGRIAMAAMIGSRAAIRARELTELRLLLELPALRKLADRGLSDEELAVIKKLADATMRSARSGDVLGYLQADMSFHLYLLDLTGDPALSEVARVLLARGPMRAPRAEESGHIMAAGAREHNELVNMLTDDMVNAAADLLRRHVARLWVGRPAPGRGSPGRNPSPATGT